MKKNYVKRMSKAVKGQGEPASVKVFRHFSVG